jgi:unsaturated rhamnogalacturonyl hydrolase
MSPRFGFPLALIACTGASPETELGPPLATLELGARIAQKGMDAWPATSLPFDWMQTVWGYGLSDLARASGESTANDYVEAWMTDALADFDGDRAFTSSDSFSPAGLASTVAAEHPELDLSPVLDAAHAYLESVPRLENGAVVHWGPDNPWGFPSDQVWIDSLFMVGMFMLREHARTGDASWLDAFAEQYLAFSDLCRDPFTQLYIHAYDGATGSTIPDENIFWARGNAWIVVAGGAYLGQARGHSDRGEIAQLVEMHARSLVELQAEDGLWWTVLDQNSVPDDPGLPANYTETSASALIATGLHMGLEAGALEDEVFRPAILKAVDGVLGRIDDPDGSPVVQGTSFGTNPGDLENYLGVAQLDDLILGVGAVLIMLAEVDGLERG